MLPEQWLTQERNGGSSTPDKWLICPKIIHCFTIRGYGVPDEVNDSRIFSLMEENSYAIINDNGTYDLYFNGEYLDTVDSLKEYENTHIYKEDIIK